MPNAWKSASMLTAIFAAAGVGAVALAASDVAALHARMQDMDSVSCSMSPGCAAGKQHAADWIEYLSTTPPNHPLLDLYISPQHFRVAPPDQLIVLSANKYQELIALIHSQRCARNIVRHGVAIYESHDAHSGLLCGLPLSDACRHLATIYFMEDLKLTTEQSAEIQAFAYDAHCHDSVAYGADSELTLRTHGEADVLALSTFKTVAVKNGLVCNVVSDQRFRCQFAGSMWIALDAFISVGGRVYVDERYDAGPMSTNAAKEKFLQLNRQFGKELHGDAKLDSAVQCLVPDSWKPCGAGSAHDCMNIKPLDVCSSLL